jgi:hypothetical protein
MQAAPCHVQNIAALVGFGVWFSMSSHHTMLSPEQVRRWHQDGFLVLPGFKSADELSQLRHRALAIVEAWQPGERAAVFSTSSNKPRAVRSTRSATRCMTATRSSTPSHATLAWPSWPLGSAW